MLNIKPKIASTNILEDVFIPPTAISGHFDRYRKNIVLNLLQYFKDHPFYTFKRMDFTDRLAQLQRHCYRCMRSAFRSLGRSNRTQCRQ